MKGACVLGDRSKILLDHHGCPACPHPDAQGPAITASNDVRINGMPALREGDIGIHAACCNTNTWKVLKGSGKVIVNGKQLVRKHDPTKHCGGHGKMIDGSHNVVDGSGDAEGADTESLREPIIEWLDRVRDNGLAELLHMVSPGVAGAFFVDGELIKLFSPECHGSAYFKHLAKCLPGKPPGWDDREPRGPHGPPPAPVRYHGPPDPGAQPVGLLDPTNPITDIVTAPFIAARGAISGLEVGGEALPRVGRAAIDAAPKAGRWVIHGAGDLVGGAGHLVGGLAGAL